MNENAAGRFEVGVMRRDEVGAVAKLHYQWFGPELGRGSSLAMLGEDWLADAFYAANFANPHQGVQVARWDGRVIAFMHYATDRRRIARWTLAHAWPVLAWCTLRSIARAPSVLRHLLGNLAYVRGENLAFIPDSDAHWTLFAVEAEFRAKDFEKAQGIWVRAPCSRSWRRTCARAACRLGMRRPPPTTRRSTSSWSALGHFGWARRKRRASSCSTGGSFSRPPLARVPLRGRLRTSEEWSAVRPTRTDANGSGHPAGMSGHF